MKLKILCDDVKICAEGTKYLSYYTSGDTSMKLEQANKLLNNALRLIKEAETCTE